MLSKPIIYALILLALAGGVFGYGRSRYNAGVAAEKLVYAQELALAKEDAQKSSDALLKDAARHEAEHVNFLQQQLEASHETQEKLKLALKGVGSVIVPGAAVRLLDDAEHPGMPEDAGTPGQSRDATPASDSTLQEQLDICRQNYQERYLPLADQMRHLQEFYNETKKTINKE